MPFYQVTRPVLTMITELVQAVNKDKALMSARLGEGKLLFERQDQPTPKVEFMTVSPFEDDPEDGEVFFVEREERYKQIVRVRAKDRNAARAAVRNGEGDDIGKPEYVDTVGEPADWNVSPEKQEE